MDLGVVCKEQNHSVKAGIAPSEVIYVQTVLMGLLVVALGRSHHNVRAGTVLRPGMDNVLMVRMVLRVRMHQIVKAETVVGGVVPMD